MTSPERALVAFLRGEVSAASLVNTIRAYAVVSDDGDGVTRVDYPGPALPRVVFSRSDVLRALDRAIDGTITVDELASWAGMLTLLDCFNLDSGDRESDEVWDALDHMAHPAISGLDDTYKLRVLRTGLS